MFGNFDFVAFFVVAIPLLSNSVTVYFIASIKHWIKLYTDVKFSLGQHTN